METSVWGRGWPAVSTSCSRDASTGLRQIIGECSVCPKALRRWHPSRSRTRRTRSGGTPQPTLASNTVAAEAVAPAGTGGGQPTPQGNAPTLADIGRGEPSRTEVGSGAAPSEIGNPTEVAAAAGVKIQVFGQTTDNARAFWNWQFIGEIPELPKTRAMLMNACDVRLPARLTLTECDVIAQIITDAAEAAMAPARAYG